MSSASGGVALAAVAANPVKASAAARTTLPRFNLAVRNLGARLRHRDIHTHLTLIAASARKSSRLEWSLAATATARSSQGAFASKSKDTHKRLREEIADLDRRIGLQIDALEQGIEPELVGERIAQLRLEKEQAEAALRDVAPDTAEPDADELIAALSRVPDLSQAVRDAPMELKRQVFEAFCLEVRYDTVERRIEISATVAEAVAKAFENAKDLPEEVSSVTTRDIAGARYVPPSDARVVERMRFAA